MVWRGLITSLVLLLNQNAFAADDSLLRLRVTAGFSNYALTQTGKGSTAPDATSQYLALGGGLTYAKGNFYFDAYGSMSIGAEHDWPTFEGDFNRTDTALTAGYLLQGGWSVYGGYKWGKSEFGRDSAPGYLLTFEAEGFFAGASKSIRQASGTTVSLSAAVAFMTGYIYDTASLDDEGSAIGTSFSATYNVPMAGGTGIQVKGFYQYYGFSDFRAAADTNETIIGAHAAYYMNF